MKNTLKNNSEKLKKIKLSDLVSLFIIIISFFPGIFLKFFKKDIVIFSERKDEAHDNSFALFQYIQEKNLITNAYYAIDFKCADYNKFNEKEKILKFGSLKHCIYTWASKTYISSQLSSGFPNRIFYYFFLEKLICNKFVFLQHGVTMNKSQYLIEPANRVNLICCVSDREKKFMEELGYNENASVVTGFARFDLLYNKTSQNNVLVMFTWRRYLSNCSDNEFCESDYFKKIKSFIENDFFSDLSREYNILFYIHPGMKKYLKEFSELKNVTIVEVDETSFSDLVSMSVALITDYSSISFDFAYMKKGVYYYQFDKSRFIEEHLEPGYFDYISDGFGPVFENESDLLNYLTSNEISAVSSEYLERSNSFFYFQDNHNRERIYKAINDKGLC